MPIEIRLPKLGETMEEGFITRWLAQEGEMILRGQPLFEVQTDKVNIEYESPAAGHLLKILIPADQAVPVLTVVGYIGNQGEAIPEQAAETPVPLQETPISPQASPMTSVAAREDWAIPAAEGQPAPAAAPEIPQAAGVFSPPAHGIATRVFASPRARREARALGADPAAIPGSGLNGRVIAADVAEYAARNKAQPATAEPPAADRRVALSHLRQIAAKRLTESFAGIPHFYLKITTDVSELSNLRASLNAEDRLTGGQKLTITGLIAKACILALRDFPQVNSSLSGTEILLHGRINLGVAVALEEGLIVPVVKEAGDLSLFDLSRRIKDLAERARLGKLGPDEYAGGTFTLTNLGMFGIDEFSAIINPPEAAILAVGRVNPTAVPQGGGYVTRSLLALTLSCDHRIIDGALGAGFLRRIKDLLEAPYLLIM